LFFLVIWQTRFLLEIQSQTEPVAIKEGTACWQDKRIEIFMLFWAHFLQAKNRALRGSAVPIPPAVEAIWIVTKQLSHVPLRVKENWQVWLNPQSLAHEPGAASLNGIWCAGPH
jgi:hypothetical protein